MIHLLLFVLLALCTDLLVLIFGCLALEPEDLTVELLKIIAELACKFIQQLLFNLISLLFWRVLFIARLLWVAHLGHLLNYSN